jgi:hypothetical protein
VNEVPGIRAATAAFTLFGQRTDLGPHPFKVLTNAPLATSERFSAIEPIRLLLEVCVQALSG